MDPHVFQQIEQGLQNIDPTTAIEAYRQGYFLDQDSDPKLESPQRRDLINYLISTTGKQIASGQKIEDFESALLSEFIVENLFKNINSTTDHNKIYQIIRFFGHVVENNTLDHGRMFEDAAHYINKHERAHLRGTEVDEDEIDYDAAHFLYAQCAKKANEQGLETLGQRIIAVSPKTLLEQSVLKYKNNIMKLRTQLWDALTLTQAISNKINYNQNVVSLNRLVVWMVSHKMIDVDNDGYLVDNYTGQDESIKKIIKLLSAFNFFNDLDEEKQISSRPEENQRDLVLTNLILWMVENNMARVTLDKNSGAYTVYLWPEIEVMSREISSLLRHYKIPVTYQDIKFDHGKNEYSIQRECSEYGGPIYYREGTHAHHLVFGGATLSLLEKISDYSIYRKYAHHGRMYFQESQQSNPLVFDIYNKVNDAYDRIAQSAQNNSEILELLSATTDNSADYVVVEDYSNPSNTGRPFRLRSINLMDKISYFPNNIKQLFKHKK